MRDKKITDSTIVELRGNVENILPLQNPKEFSGIWAFLAAHKEILEN